MTEKINIWRLIIKTLLIIIVIAFLIVPLTIDNIGSVSLYNVIFPGRPRLPFSDFPQESYNLSLYDLDAMFNSHLVSAEPTVEEEFRVFIFGDSSCWGTLLKPEDTLAGKLNAMDLKGPGGSPARFYNLGYPTLSLTKDLMLLDRSLEYDPDLIIWLFTLESFPDHKQLSSPLVQNNPGEVAALLNKYQLEIEGQETDLARQTYWDSTLFNQRRNLADIFRLQLYGVMWAITSIDQYYPPEYERAARDLSSSTAYYDWQEGPLPDHELLTEILLSGRQAAGSVPVIYINEPILISTGENSDIRYNFYYPRWAYDQYRDLLLNFTSIHDLPYIDAWSIIPEDEFTNTAIHFTPQGVQILAGELLAEMEVFLSR